MRYHHTCGQNLSDNGGVGSECGRTNGKHPKMNKIQIVACTLLCAAIIGCCFGCKGSNGGSTSAASSTSSTTAEDEDAGFSDEMIERMVVHALCEEERVDSLYGLEIGRQEVRDVSGSPYYFISGTYYTKDKYGSYNDKKKFDIAIDGLGRVTIQSNLNAY